jgi:hypothetical protein
MTSRKHQKRLARTRAARTGEAYTTALRHLRTREARGADMPTDTPTGTPDADAGAMVLNCSFCAQPSTEVAKLIAGPSVYICDSCIGLCNEILARDGELSPPGEGDEPPLAERVLLARIRLRSRELADREAQLRGWVAEARTSFGIDWSRLATELGTTPEAARERYPS